MISVKEILDILIMSLVIGYIFSGYIRRPTRFRHYLKRPGFNFDDFKFATIIAAPAIVLHELAHKFVAIAFGISAVFKIFWGGLGLAVFLKLIHSPFLIIAPGYVLISEGATMIQTTLIAFAGPFVNLVLFITSRLILKKARKLTREQAIAIYLTMQINLLLFVFNMLPIPPLDGSKVFGGLIKLFSSF